MTAPWCLLTSRIAARVRVRECDPRVEVRVDLADQQDLQREESAAIGNVRTVHARLRGSSGAASAVVALARH